MNSLFHESEVLGLFSIALVVFAWFAMITFLLIKFIPQNKFNNIPIAVGAWIAGVLLASLMLTFWGNFSLIMGAVFVVLAAFILTKKQALFLRQFAYCIWVAGQNAVISIPLNGLINSFHFSLFNLPCCILVILFAAIGSLFLSNYLLCIYQVLR